MPIDRTAPQPAVPTPTLDTFAAQVGALAQKMGIPSLVIMARDPRTKTAKFYASSVAKDDLRPLAAEKFELFDGGETGWDA